MKPLSTLYDHEVSCWLRTNPGRVVSIYQVAKLYDNAFIKAATMETAINGFRKTGIWPVNRGVFNDHDFAPSETTDRLDPFAIPPSVSAEIISSKYVYITNYSCICHGLNLLVEDREYF